MKKIKVLSVIALVLMFALPLAFGGFAPSNMTLVQASGTAPEAPVTLTHTGLVAAPAVNQMEYQEAVSIVFTALCNAGDPIDNADITWVHVSGIHGTLPTGLNFNNGVLSGDLTATGSFQFEIHAANISGTTSETFIINVVEEVEVPSAITVSGGATQTFIPGAAISFTVTTTPADATLVVLDRPTWLTFDAATRTFSAAAGVTSGTTHRGTHTFTVYAVTLAGSERQVITINIDDNAIDAINVVAGTLPTEVVIGDAVNVTFEARSGAVAATNVAWTLNGANTGGLTINENTGVLSGTPTAAGVLMFNVIATNDNNSLSRAVQLVIHATTPDAPNTVNGTLPNRFNYNTPIIPVTFTVANNATGVTWSYNGNLPAGITLNETTGELSGTPTQRGAFQVYFTATNLGGSASTVPFTFVVTETLNVEIHMANVLVGGLAASSDITIYGLEGTGLTHANLTFEVSKDGETWTTFVSTSDLTVGEWKVRATFAGNDYYAAFTATSMFNVTQSPNNNMMMLWIILGVTLAVGAVAGIFFFGKNRRKRTA